MRPHNASKGLKRDELLAKGTFNASPDFIADNCSFENEYCIKIIKEAPDVLLDKVTPFVNRHKNGNNIPSLSLAAAQFIRRYSCVAKSFGFTVDKSDYTMKTERYKKLVGIVDILKENEMLDDFYYNRQAANFDSLFGLRDASVYITARDFVSAPVDDSELPKWGNIVVENSVSLCDLYFQPSIPIYKPTESQ